MGPNILRAQSRVRTETLGASAAKAQQYITAGYRWMVDLDQPRPADGRTFSTGHRQEGLRLIGAFLKAGVLENGLVSPAEEGTPLAVALPNAYFASLGLPHLFDAPA